MNTGYPRLPGSRNQRFQ